MSNEVRRYMTAQAVAQMDGVGAEAIRSRCRAGTMTHQMEAFDGSRVIQLFCPDYVNRRLAELREIKNERAALDRMSRE